DPDDGCAVCLAREFEPCPIPIQETRTKLTVEWNADYRIEDDAFTVADSNGSVRTIPGYPTEEIQRLVQEDPAGSREDYSSETDSARERLRTGRNERCPCGSGRKYNKCCLAKDEAVVRSTTLTRPTATIQRAGSV